MSPDKLKRKRYGRRFLALRELLNRYDPIALIKLGAPEDEYDPEVARLLPALERCGDAAGVERELQRLFGAMFSPEDAAIFEQWKSLADDVWALVCSPEWNDV